MKNFSLEFLTREGCGLCREAEPHIARAARLLGAPVRTVDIERTPEMAVDWGLRIPVVRTAGGRVLGEGRIRFWPLVVAMARARLVER